MGKDYEFTRGTNLGADHPDGLLRIKSLRRPTISVSQIVTRGEVEVYGLVLDRILGSCAGASVPTEKLAKEERLVIAKIRQ